QARIKTLGLLGDKFLEISTGSPQLPVIPDEGQIPAAQPTNVDALLSSGEDVMDNVVEISHSLSVILGRMERGEGLLGELTSDSESGRRLRGSLVGTAESMQRIADKVDTGQGPIGRLLNDRAMADKLARSLDRFDALLASGEDVMDNVVEISASLSDILGRMERGEGLLGELTSNSPSGERLKNSLIGTSETLQRIANKIETGDGPLPRLLNDRAMADQLTQSLDRLNGLLASAQTGPGLLPGLLNDPATKTQFDQTLASLNQVARDLQGFTADLEKSDALLPKLVKDEEYGREITNEIRDIVNRLDTISVRLTEGKGTAAKLINDPQVYEAVNDILIGVNESRFLRWLIRNRQNAGIKKRYDDTRDALEQSGQTPPPLEGAPGEGEKKVEEEGTGTAPPPAESAEPVAPPRESTESVPPASSPPPPATEPSEPPPAAAGSSIEGI
ncbi:MAG TPA: hypothetical protein VHU81_09570, partial [Thermoanaerobaculia bacterium]|nr:hypothetical protein [Thermoanaerobaculia bacterium]